MDLKGAEVRNFYNLTNEMGSGSDSTSELIRVPHYQRPYKWTKEFVLNLIEDWERENEKKMGAEYFAGSIVTVVNNDTNRCHQLIDGQQRFTTIYLVNFLLFLLLRVTLRQAIKSNKLAEISKLVERQEQSIEYSFVKSDSDSVLDLHAYTSAFEDQNQDDLDGILDGYLAKVKLPSMMEDDDGFHEAYVADLKEFIRDNELRLSYDRSSYNGSLGNALSRVIVKLSDTSHPVVETNREGLTDESVEQVYLNAIDQIADSFIKIGTSVAKAKSEEKSTYKLNSHNVSISIIDSLVSFLSGVKLCVIQTGNQKDAYTLFEVLNDRSFSLDDLDLIKNQFYRNFCEKCGLNETVIDEEINKREEQWGDVIFASNTDSNKKLIAYLATSYLTGSTNIGFKSHDEHRGEIKRYLEKSSQYSQNELETDFNIFQIIKIFIQKFEIVTQRREAKALEAEFSNKTITYKTVHLLLALGYEGILAGLTNHILQYIKLKAGNGKFELGSIEAFLDELVNTKTSHKEIHSQAQIIWQCTLMTEDYKQPKELANRLISNSTKDGDILDLRQVNLDSNDLHNWLNPWRYKNSSLKVRILFARLLQLSVINDKLTSTTFNHNISGDDSKKLHLDHMEPESPDPSHPHAYYKINKIERDDDINGLGNMFPLPGDLNISKSNKPMVDAFGYLNTSGLGQHWLTVETKKLFDRNNNSKVPNQEFFTKRKEYLIKMFEEAIRM